MKMELFPQKFQGSIPIVCIHSLEVVVNITNISSILSIDYTLYTQCLLFLYQQAKLIVTCSDCLLLDLLKVVTKNILVKIYL